MLRTRSMIKFDNIVASAKIMRCLVCDKIDYGRIDMENEVASGTNVVNTKALLDDVSLMTRVALNEKTLCCGNDHIKLMTKFNSDIPSVIQGD